MSERTTIKEQWRLYKKERVVTGALLGSFLVIGVQVVYVFNDVETSKMIGAFASMLLSFGFVSAAAPLAAKESGAENLLTSAKVFRAKIVSICLFPTAITTLSLTIAILTMLYTGFWIEPLIYYASVYLTILTHAISSLIAAEKSDDVWEAYKASRQMFVLPALPMTGVMFAMVSAPSLIAIPFALQVALFVAVLKVAKRKLVRHNHDRFAGS